MQMGFAYGALAIMVKKDDQPIWRGSYSAGGVYFDKFNADTERERQNRYQQQYQRAITIVNGISMGLASANGGIVNIDRGTFSAFSNQGEALYTAAKYNYYHNSWDNTSFGSGLGYVAWMGSVLVNSNKLNVGFSGFDLSKYQKKAPRLLSQISFTEKFINSLADYLGAPYQYGCSETNGIDCSGLIVAVLEATERWTTKSEGPPEGNWGQGHIFTNVNDFRNYIERADLLVWPQIHAAVFLGGSDIIHSYGINPHNGVVITDDLYSRMIRKFGLPVVYRWDQPIVKFD